MAMGNNPMMYIDADGRTWNPFKAIGQAWDYAWDKGNQFAQWADEVGIPSFNMGVGMNSAGQISPLVNGQAINTNPYGSDQNTIAAINNARGEYFSQQHTNAIHNQQLNNQIMSVPYALIRNIPINYKNAVNWTNEHLFIDVELRIDHGVQAGVDVEVLGLKAGLSGEKATKPIAQLNFGFNHGFYGDETSPPYQYAYGNVKNPIRTSWNAGIGILGASQTYAPHRKLFNVGPLNQWFVKK